MGEHGLTYIDLETIKVGDVVGYVQNTRIPASYGRMYKYFKILPVTVSKITPKRTKFTLTFQDGSEKQCATRYNGLRLCELNENAQYQNRMSNVYIETEHYQYQLDYTKGKYDLLFKLDQIEDEDLLKVHELYKYLYEKYVKGKEVK